MLNINIGQTRSKHTQVMQYHTRLIPGVALANISQYLRYLSFLVTKVCLRLAFFCLLMSLWKAPSTDIIQSFSTILL